MFAVETHAGVMKQVDYPKVSPREQEILQYIIRNFIITASPIASKTLVDRHQLKLSSASVRSAMNSLEQKGYLNHPHTSAGRIPTDLGYRYYVDSLMDTSGLSQGETQLLDAWHETLKTDLTEGVRMASRMLAKLSNLLAIVIAPTYAQGRLRKLELIDVSSHRVLVVLTIDSGIVKTITIEVEMDVSRKELDETAQLFNERFSGLRLRDISAKIKEMLADKIEETSTGLIRVFIDSADMIFEDTHIKRFYFGGVEYMAMQPEFSDLKTYKSIVELLENEDLIIHLLSEQQKQSSLPGEAEIRVRIGKENALAPTDQISVVASNYSIGSMSGTIGLVGPTRMDYPKMMALVEQMTRRFSNNKQ